MKILVTGVNGQLGFDVVRELMKRNITSSITEGNTRTNTKDELSVASLQSSGVRYEIIATDVISSALFFEQIAEDNEELRMKNEEWKSEHPTPNTEKLTFVSLDITDKAAVHRLICGEKSPSFCVSASSPNASIGEPVSLSPDCLSADEAARSPATYCPSSCAQSQEPVTLGCNDSRNGLGNASRNELCNGFCNDSCNGFPKNSSFSAAKPDCVVHCAAYTSVDAAEDNEELCRAVNVEGTRNIAEACKEIGAKMIYISTDYVFSGEGTEPWQADCRDFAPQNVYGKSKLDGEFAVAENLDKFFIVRTAWVFGNHGNNFVKTMLKVGATHDEVRVVNDQIGTPTYTPDLAKLLCDMAESDKYGYYHATNEGGFISWYDFTCEIYRQAGYNTKVIPVTTAEYGLSKAKRPFNSRFNKSKLEENGFKPLPEWVEALSKYLYKHKDCDTIERRECNMERSLLAEDCGITPKYVAYTESKVSIESIPSQLKVEDCSVENYTDEVRGAIKMIDKSGKISFLASDAKSLINKMVDYTSNTLNVFVVGDCCNKVQANKFGNHIIEYAKRN